MITEALARASEAIFFCVLATRSTWRSIPKIPPGIEPRHLDEKKPLVAADVDFEEERIQSRHPAGSTSGGVSLEGGQSAGAVGNGIMVFQNLAEEAEGAANGELLLAEFAAGGTW